MRNLFPTALLVFVSSILVTIQCLGQNSPDTLLRVRQVVVEGNETTKDFVILREMKLKRGEKLSRETIEHDQKRIYSLQLFNKVDINYSAEGDEAIVRVHVDERWYFFPFPILGFRYRDINNLYYGAGVVHNNFRGRNEKLFGSFALGFDRWARITYQNPKLTDDDDIFFGITGAIAKVRNLSETSGFNDQTNMVAGITLGKRFGLYQLLSGWLNYDVWQFSDPRAQTDSSSGRDAFITLGAAYVIDQRDLREYPTDGFYLSISAAKYGFGESDVNIFRYGYDIRLYNPVGDDISLNARSFANFVGGGIVPTYRHVYFGYDERIRGYFKDVLEGENIFGSSVEVRVQLLKPHYYTFPYALLPEFAVWRYALYAAVFADVGKTWYRNERVLDDPWYAGYGAGLHFLLPYSFILRTEYAFNQHGVGQFVLDFGASF